ncbi:MAG: hypothetical protein Q8Q20_00815 [bacterium]|nr:hypothetical protein [bacterium]
MTFQAFLVVLHIAGVVLGVGAATISDILFLRVMRRQQLSVDELQIMKILGRVIWTGLALLFASGFGILISMGINNADLLSHAPAKVLVKLCITVIVFLNGLALHWYIHPLLEKLSQQFDTGILFSRKGLMFTSGGLSIASWWTALILGAWRGLDQPFWIILGAYALFVLASITGAHVVSRWILKRSGLHPSHIPETNV